MALQFVAGGSGSGKSHYIYSRIIAGSMEDKDARFFVMVPEQFTMQTQKELVELHPAHSIMNIDVLSFNSLAKRVFEETGFIHEPILEDMGKTLVLQKVIWDKKTKLSVLGRTMQKAGGVEEAKSILSELMQYDHTPEDVAEMAKSGQISPVLSEKLADIAVIYKGFNEYISGKYLAAEEVCEALAKVISGSDIIKGSTVVLDGFTGFVPMQLLVIRELLKLAKDVIVVITVDAGGGSIFRESKKQELFHMSRKMARELKTIAEEEEVPFAEPVFVGSDTGARFAESPAIDFLEKNLFRYSSRQFKEKQSDILIIEAGNIDSEAAAAASMIKKLVRTEGFKYGDFAVVSADVKKYGKKMRAHLEDCGIPCFLDEKQSVLSNVFVQFIKNAVGLFAEDFSYSSVFAFLRTGLLDFTDEEIDIMENYCLGTGIRGYKQYSGKWVRIPKGKKGMDFERLNSLRERFMETLQDTAEVFKTRQSSVRAKTEALYRLANSCNVQEKLKAAEEKAAASGNKMREKEYAQIYKAVCDFFDKLVSVLGDEKTGTAAYAALMEAGFSQMKIGIIPTGPDEVHIGDIERSRVKNVKVLIFMGLNDGLVPKRSEKAGLLAADDREALKDLGTELAPSGQDDIYIQRLYLYLNMTLESRRLILTYKKTDTDASAMLPSYLIGAVVKMFPDIQIINADDKEFLPERLETAPGRQHELIKEFRAARQGGENGSFLELCRSMQKDEENSAKLDRYLQAAVLRGPEPTIGKAAAEALYEKRYSVTRLQEFAGCAFAHFCDYGLKLLPRAGYDLDNRDMGNIFHEVMKRLFDKAAAFGGVASLSEEQIDKLTDEAMDEALGNSNGTIMLEGGRNSAAAGRIRRILHETARVVCAQMAAGSFHEAGTEVPYRYKNITGVIDRYDICRTGDTAYVRVIDYKSGSEDMDYTGLYYGLQIQLPVYMAAALDKTAKLPGVKKADPAGMYYMHFQVPVIEAEDLAAEPQEDDILNVCRFTGITLADADAADLQDASAHNKGGSRVIKVRFKKDGSFYSTSAVFSEGDMRLIERYTERLVTDLQSAIENGKASVSPAVSGDEKKDSCEYCDYRPVCGFDTAIPGYKKKTLQKYDKNSICQAMSSKLSGGGR